jgi:cytochrome oxidase Cu insertion factor (SCO1/SenC/PrrC family)
MMTPRSYHRMTTLAFLVAASIIAAPAAAAQGAAKPALGPTDGAGLPPLDTGRVVAGTVAPDFTLEAKDGGTVTLSRFRGKKNVVLVFYRGHW